MKQNEELKKILLQLTLMDVMEKVCSEKKNKRVKTKNTGSNTYFSKHSIF